MSSDRIEPADLPTPHPKSPNQGLPNSGFSGEQTRHSSPHRSNHAPDDSCDVPSEQEVIDLLNHLWTESEPLSPPAVTTDVPPWIDHFQLMRLVGQGGMGRVYLAIDHKLDRQVAIKLPLWDRETDPNLLERFRREGQAAGALKHPNVVAIHGIGEADTGCYIVSEYVEGPTLRDLLKSRDQPLPPRCAARLILTIARGVSAAHAESVIHRDLKPSNILLEKLSGDSSQQSPDPSIVQIDGQWYRPKVADFGLAGFVDQRTALTMSGALVGTASYMAPEQISEQPLGPPADTFALGVLLYECITGDSPFSRESYVATIERLRNHDPQPLTKTASGIHPDLSAICEYAIRKEPHRRYGDAGELADDLQRYLDGQPVRARALGPAGRLQRWVRRHPAQASLIAVICTALLVSMLQNRRLQASLDRADQLQQDLLGTTADLTKTNREYRETIYVQDMIAAFDALKDYATDDVRSLLSRQLPAEGQDDLRGIEWYVLQSLMASKPPQAFAGHDGEVYDIAVTPDGSRFFSVGEDRRRRLWDLNRGELIRVSDRELIGRSHAIAVSRDGNRFYTGGNFLSEYEVHDGSLLSNHPITHHEYGIRAIALAPDERYIASLCLQHEIHLNSLDSEQPYALNEIAVPAQRCTRIDFSPDSRQLYFTKQLVRRGEKHQSPRQFVAWDIDSQQEVFASPPDNRTSYFGPVDASADGKRVAIGGHRHVQFFDPRRNRFDHKLGTSHSLVLDLEFSPDDSRIAIGSQDGTLQCVNLNASLAPWWASITSFRSRPHNQAINTVAWVDSERVLTGDAGGRILLHTIHRSERRTEFNDSLVCELDPDGQRLLCIDTAGTGTLFDPTTGEMLKQVTGLPTKAPEQVAIGPTGRILALSYHDQVQVWDLDDQRLRFEVKHRPTSFFGASSQTFGVTSVSISPDARRMVTRGTSDGYVLVWDLQSGELVREILRVNLGYGGRVAYSPDGKYLLCAGEKGAVVVDLGSGREVALDVSRTMAVRWLSSTEVLLNSADGLLASFDVVTGSANTVYSDQFHVGLHVAVGPDRLSIISADTGRVRFWHGRSRRFLGSIPLKVASIAFSPNGDALYITTKSREANTFELRVITNGK